MKVTQRNQEYGKKEEIFLKIIQLKVGNTETQTNFQKRLADGTK